MTRVLFFFFSSRRRHTRLQGDWSSDVCSSDLHTQRAARGNAPNSSETVEGPKTRSSGVRFPAEQVIRPLLHPIWRRRFATIYPGSRIGVPGELPYRRRSEERRVGKECRSRWSP